MHKEKACGYEKKERKKKIKNEQVFEVELGAKAHLKKKKENKDSPCFSAIIFKSK
jgi:hypothetical protein